MFLPINLPHRAHFLGFLSALLVPDNVFEEPFLNFNIESFVWQGETVVFTPEHSRLLQKVIVYVGATIDNE